MSRLLPDPPLLVEIGRQSIRVSAPGGAPQSVAPATPGTAADAPPVMEPAFSWGAALAALEPLVRRLRPKRAVLNIVLSDAWLRYFVIDWPAQKLAPDEAAAFAAQAFSRVYDQTAHNWRLLTVPTGRSGQRLLCGIELGIAAGLDDLAQRSGWQIDRLTGGFAAAFDLTAPLLGGGTGYLVFSGDGMAHCARLEGGALTLVRGQAMAHSDAASRVALARRCAAVGPPDALRDPVALLLTDCDPADFPVHVSSEVSAGAARNLRRELSGVRHRGNRFLSDLGRVWHAA